MTTQQRSGEGSATLADTMSVPVEPIAVQPRVHEPRFTSSVEPSTAVPPQEPETVLTKSKGRNNRTKRRRNTKGEEKMLDEIFDDVFNDDSPPARSNPAAQSFAALSATASASQESSRAAGDRLTAAATVTRPSAKSSRSSFEANPATIGMLVAVMLVAAGGWYVWQNGIPSFSGSGNGNGTLTRPEPLRYCRQQWIGTRRWSTVRPNPNGKSFLRKQEWNCRRCLRLFTIKPGQLRMEPRVWRLRNA